jgi:hypothetical protein
VSWCVELGKVEVERSGKTTMTMKSFLLTCGVFCGGYVTNTTLDTALEAAESYFHVHPAAYKTDANGYVICSPEKPKITFAADSN